MTATTGADALTREQQAVLARSAPLAHRWDAYLAGGMALALHLGHRRSADFDWFTPRTLAPAEVLKDLQSLAMPIHVRQNDEGTFLGQVGGIDYSVFRYPYPLVEPPIRIASAAVASVTDIAAMKMTAIAQRATKRDYVDLHAILCSQRLGLRDVLFATRAKSPSPMRFRIEGDRGADPEKAPSDFRGESAAHLSLERAVRTDPYDRFTPQRFARGKCVVGRIARSTPARSDGQRPPARVDPASKYPPGRLFRARVRCTKRTARRACLAWCHLHIVPSAVGAAGGSARHDHPWQAVAAGVHAPWVRGAREDALGDSGEANARVAAVADLGDRKAATARVNGVAHARGRTRTAGRAYYGSGAGRKAVAAGAVGGDAARLARVREALRRWEHKAAGAGRIGGQAVCADNHHVLPARVAFRGAFGDSGRRQ